MMEMRHQFMMITDQIIDGQMEMLKLRKEKIKPGNFFPGG
jgi:hypothetical protein